MANQKIFVQCATLCTSGDAPLVGCIELGGFGTVAIVAERSPAIRLAGYDGSLGVGCNSPIGTCLGSQLHGLPNDWNTFLVGAEHMRLSQ